MISLDLETEPIDRAYAAPEPICVSWLSREPGHEPRPFVLPIDEARPMIEGWLRGNALLIGANIAYDMACLGECWPDLLPAIFAKYARGQVEDVLLRQRLIDIASVGGDDMHSLESLCKHYDLPPVDKSGPWRLEFAALKGVPIRHWPDGAREYVLADADRPALAYDAQAEYEAEWLRHSGGQRLLHLGPAEAQKAFVLHLIECWGVRTDPARCAKLERYLARYMRHGAHWLKRAGLVRANGTRDTKAAKARMEATCKARGARVPRTKTGEISLNKDACSGVGDGLLELYSEFSQAGTLAARVQDLCQGVDLPLQTRFNSLLQTGRTSSSKPSPPLVGNQAQNLPRKAGARECIVPRAGHVFVSADLPSAELRSLSQVNLDVQGASVMADQLNAGRDLHLWFGAQVLGLTYEAALARAGEKEVKAARQHAKPCNFGFPGGMGVAKFVLYAWTSYRVRMEPERAAELKGIWLAAFAEMPGFFAYVDSLMGSDWALVRHLRSGRWRGRVSYCAACNTQFQELTANAAAAGLVETSRRCYTDRRSALWSSRPVMYTHDEIVLETPESVAHDAALELSAVMADEFTKWHPDVPALACTGPGKDPRVVAPVVSRRYSKEMEAVWQQGKLIPWDLAA